MISLQAFAGACKTTCPYPHCSCPEGVPQAGVYQCQMVSFDEDPEITHHLKLEINGQELEVACAPIPSSQNETK